MSKNMKLLLKWMKQYIDEPNVPDYSGEYPPCWEITQEDVKEILEYINSLQQENKQQKEQLQQRDEVIDEAIEYINKHIRIDDKYPDHMEMLVEECNELLDILNKYKGDNK